MDIFAQQSAYFQIYTKLEDEDEALVYWRKAFSHTLLDELFLINFLFMSKKNYF